MSRNNNVRGPTSALTEFLRESGINVATVARRVATRGVPQQQPAAGPSNEEQSDEKEGGAEGEEEEEEPSPRRPARRRVSGYNSDDLDEPEESEKPVTAKKRKLTKAAEEKLKAKEKATKKKGKKNQSDDEDEDAYTAISKAAWGGASGSKPPIGSLDICAKCEKEFSINKYTVAADPPPGYLCIPCAKLSGNDPFKKAAVPRKRAPPKDKRTITHYDERRFPSLAKLCIQIITRHINDVEALGDIGNVNMDEIAKAISKQRSMTAENAHLFYDVTNKALTLYDLTKLTPPGFCALANLNPNLTHLRLDFCGRMDDTVMDEWSNSFSSLTHLDLFGPFLVRQAGWISFFESHPNLVGFRITQSPRFDHECIKALVKNCPGIQELRLKEVGKLDDTFLEEIAKFESGLTVLDLADPSQSCTETALVDLMKVVGPTLTLLDLSGHSNLTDAFLMDGVAPYTRVLMSLALNNLADLTDEGVGKFFDEWASTPAGPGPTVVEVKTKSKRKSKGAAKDLPTPMDVDTIPNPSLTNIEFGRNHELGSAALHGLLAHSQSRLHTLNINGWKTTSADALRGIRKAAHLSTLDVGWCREMDDEVMKAIVDGCERLKEIKCWGCSKLTDCCPRKRGMAISGVEAQSYA